MQSEPINSMDIISLRDIFNTLFKHKTIIFISVVIALIAGLVIFFTRPQLYSFKQGINTANYLSGSSKILLENTDDLVGKIKEIYIPQFFVNYFATHAPLKRLNIDAYRISPTQANNSKDPLSKIHDAGVLYLYMETTKDNKPMFDELRNFILQALVADQNRLVLAEQNETNQILEIMKPIAAKNANSMSIDYLNVQLQIQNLQQKLSSLTPANFLGDVIITPLRKISVSMFIMFSLFVGLLAGISLALLLETWQKMRK